MAIPIILAMTATEIQNNPTIASNIAYLSCHFSPTGAGLSDLPPFPSAYETIILDDSIPISGHKPDIILQQLTELKPKKLLLDFQRPPTSEAQRMIDAIVHTQRCPTAVARNYAEALSCPIFLPPVPLCVPIEEYLHPWNGREIWLELALDALEITVNAQGSVFTPLPYAQTQAQPHRDSLLHCHYTITTDTDALRFYLYRTLDDIIALTSSLHSGVTNALGLFQELSQMPNERQSSD